VPARLLALALFALGCTAEEPPAITVGPVSFAEDQLIGLTPARASPVALVTALGLAVADSSTVALGAPLIASRIEDRLLAILAAELTLEKNGVGVAALQDAYRADPQWELTVEHLLVFSERWRSPDHREAAAGKAARARALLADHLDFPAVEDRLSGEPGGDARAGELPPGREGAWVPEFWAAALGLEPGELSPVTETQYGFHVLRLEARSIVPFSEARSTVARRVAGGIERPAAVLEAWMSATPADASARRVAALAEARARGLDVPPGERAEIERTWEDQAAAWAAALGLAYGHTPPRIGVAALAALARTGQSADLARRDLAAHADLLRARYAIAIGTEVGAQP
jgi:hypothetical protein